MTRPAELHDQSSDYHSPMQVLYDMSTEVRFGATYTQAWCVRPKPILFFLKKWQLFMLEKHVACCLMFFKKEGPINSSPIRPHQSLAEKRCGNLLAMEGDDCGRRYHWAVVVVIMVIR